MLQRVDALVAGELLVDREKVAGRRLRRRRQLGHRAEPGVELLRPDLDVVAPALLAEADVERHHAPVREALLRLGKSAVESRTTAVLSTVSFTRARRFVDRRDDLLELLVLRQARDRAGLAQCLHLLPVRGRGEATTATLGHASLSARVASTPSSPGSR